MGFEVDGKKEVEGLGGLGCWGWRGVGFSGSWIALRGRYGSQVEEETK